MLYMLINFNDGWTTALIVKKQYESQSLWKSLIVAVQD